MAVNLDIQPVFGRKALRAFIHLPEKLHTLHKNWVPPLYLDEWQYFNPKKNKAFSYCDTILLLAFQDGAPVGRIMGVINPRYNRLRNEKTARFSRLESVEDFRVVRELLNRVEQWAREKGMTTMIGPYGFSDQDPEGFLVEGFEHPATIATYCNHAWMPRFVENHDYQKDVDYVTYKIHIPSEVPKIYTRLHERIRKRGSLEVIEPRNKKEAAAWAKPAFRLMNECYTQEGIYGYAPMEDDEINALLKRYMPLLDPRFLKGLRHGDELVGFVVGIPDMTEGIREARGRLLPFGFLKILKARKKARQLDLLLGAIKQEHRGKGGDVLMMVAMGMSVIKAGMEVIDTHHQMETNKKMRAVSELLGGEVYKRHRVYRKKL
jgi:hypothetical protein